MAKKKYKKPARTSKKRKGKQGTKGGMKTFFTLWVILLIIGLGGFFSYRFLKERTISKEAKERKPSSQVIYKQISLYFSDDQALYLVKEKRRIEQRSKVTRQAKEIIQELIKGPRDKGLVPTIPPKTSLRGIVLGKEGTMKVDFSPEITIDHPGGSSSEILTVYSIVNTLVFNFPQVKRVKITVNGKEIDTLAGHIYMKDSFEPDEKIVKSEA